MVSGIEEQTVVRSAFDKNLMEPLPEAKNIRIRFRKTGKLQFISHLDLQRVMSRVLARSGVPAWFTQGFNPHPKMVFAMPLPIGVQSFCEYLDIRIDRRITLKEIEERINSQVTDELKVSRVYIPSTKFSEIAYVGYEITVDCNGLSAYTAKKAEELLTSSPLMMKKHTKSGDKEVDITALIKSVSAEFSEGKLIVKTVLKGGEGSLNPEMLVTAMKERLGILADYPGKGYYSIIRTNLYFEDMREFE